MSEDELISNLTLAIRLIETEIERYQQEAIENNNAFFLCKMATIIFRNGAWFKFEILVMQAGFAFLETGAVRSKNCTNILLMKLLESCRKG